MKSETHTKAWLNERDILEAVAEWINVRLFNSRDIAVLQPDNVFIYQDTDGKIGAAAEYTMESFGEGDIPDDPRT